MDNDKNGGLINGFIENNSVIKILTTYFLTVFFINVILTSLVNIHILGYNIEMKSIVMLPLLMQLLFTYLLYRRHKNTFMKLLTSLTLLIALAGIAYLIYGIYYESDFLGASLFLNVVLGQLICQVMIGFIFAVGVFTKKIQLNYLDVLDRHILIDVVSYVIVCMPILVFVDMIFYYNMPIKYFFFFAQIVWIIGLIRKDKKQIILWCILLKVIVFSILYFILAYHMPHLNNEENVQMIKTFLILIQLLFELFLLYVLFVYYDEEKMEKKNMKKALVFIIINVVWSLNLLSLMFLMFSYVVTCFNPLLISILSGISKGSIGIDENDIK